MIKLEDAKQLKLGQIIYEIGQFNADKTPKRWRVNGNVKTWVRSPHKVQVPLKHGMYVYDYLDENTLDKLCLTEKEAIDEYLSS